MIKIARESLTERAYAALLEEIASGAFEPRQPFVIRTLAINYGISATPIREALQRLVAEGILVQAPNRSIVIPEMKAERFRQLLPVRVALEGLACALAATQMTPARLSQLETLYRQILRTTDTYDAAAYLKLNREFHFAIYEAADNADLLQIITSLWLKVGPVFTGLFNAEMYREHANDEHAAILHALRQGNPEAARRAMAQDLEHAAEALLPKLEV